MVGENHEAARMAQKRLQGFTKACRRWFSAYIQSTTRLVTKSAAATVGGMATQNLGMTDGASGRASATGAFFVQKN